MRPHIYRGRAWPDSGVEHPMQWLARLPSGKTIGGLSFESVCRYLATINNAKLWLAPKAL